MEKSTIQAQQEERARIGLRASLVGLLVNALLAVSKIIAGSVSGSVSILADGLNNLSDTGSVLISWMSMHIARKPEDRDHPLGHGRFEYIGALAIAVVILYVGIDLLKSSINAIVHPHKPLFTWWIAAFTALGIPLKIFLYIYYKKRGKAYKLATLNAAAQDSFNDVLITSAVLIGLFLSHFWGLMVDGWLGLLVSCFILWSGFSLIRNTITLLVGGKPDKETGSKILAIISKHPQIKGIHDFVLHDYGPENMMASIHVEVDALTSLLDVHDVVDSIEQEVLQTLHLPITIHMDPVLPIDAPGQEVKQRIAQFLKEQDTPLSMHDFRIVPGKRVTKLIFDLVVPESFQDDQALIQRIASFAQSLDTRYECVIGIDRDYFAEQPDSEEHSGA
ncbi:MAG: cation transporter [Clostridiales bacterium]|nr:cation transporter [Clostridiales bacterium]